MSGFARTGTQISFFSRSRLARDCALIGNTLPQYCLIVAEFVPNTLVNLVLKTALLLERAQTMTQTQLTDPYFADTVLGLVCEERSKSLSKREWVHRLKGLGLYISDNKVFTLRRDHTVCELPPYLCE